MSKINEIKVHIEQLWSYFSKMKEIKNIKSKNEAHFKLFLLYILDLHNLHIEQKVDLLANPLNFKRYEVIQKMKDDLAIEGLGKLSLKTVEEIPKTY